MSNNEGWSFQFQFQFQNSRKVRVSKLVSTLRQLVTANLTADGQVFFFSVVLASAIVRFVLGSVVKSRRLSRHWRDAPLPGSGFTTAVRRIQRTTDTKHSWARVIAFPHSSNCRTVVQSSTTTSRTSLSVLCCIVL